MKNGKTITWTYSNYLYAGDVIVMNGKRYRILEASPTTAKVRDWTWRDTVASKWHRLAHLIKQLRGQV